jgi:hypothetical protein
MNSASSNLLAESADVSLRQQQFGRMKPFSRKRARFS